MSDSTTPRNAAGPGLIAPIQYLRGFAAMLVVWHHGQEQFPALKGLFHAEFGGSGVDLFFVISGFIMVVTTAASSGGALRFIRRRIVRVVPLYWLLTALLVSVALAAPSLFRTVHPGFEHVLKSLLFIPHYSPGHPGMAWPILVPGWTLNFEMFFYAVFALSLCMPQRWRLASLIAVFAALVGAGFVFDPPGAVAWTYTSPLLIEFAVGAVIGHLWLAGRLSPGPVWVVVAMTAGMALLLSRNTWLSSLPQTVGAGVIVAAALNERVRHWKSPLLQALGDASYSIYLTHLFSLGVLRWLWPKFGAPPSGWFDGIVFMVLGMVFSGAIGWLSYRHLELPLLHKFNALFDRRAAKGQLAGAGSGA